jgi:hypothetical protein
MAVLLCVRTLLCGRPLKMGIAGGPIGRRRLAPTAPKVASALTREPPPPTVPSSNFPGREGERFRSGLNPSCTHHFHPHSNLTLPTVHSPALLFTTEPHHPLPPTLSQLSPVLPRGHQAMASKFPSFFSPQVPKAAPAESRPGLRHEALDPSTNTATFSLPIDQSLLRGICGAYCDSLEVFEVILHLTFGVVGPT